MESELVRENVHALQARRKAEAERDAAKREAAMYRRENEELHRLVQFYRDGYSMHRAAYISKEKASKLRVRELAADCIIAGAVVLALLGITALVWNLTFAYWN